MTLRNIDFLSYQTRSRKRATCYFAVVETWRILHEWSFQMKFLK